MVDECGHRAAPGVVGELVVRGANVMRGYWNRPEENAKRLRTGPVGETLLYTGDLFKADADGYLYFVSRKDDVFKCRGEKVSPKEVENALYELDAVAEAAVVGIPHEIKGQGIAAFVTLEANRRPDEQLKKELTTWVGKQIGSLAKPDQIRFTEALPKTRSGKIMRRLLKEVAGGGEVKGDVTTLEDFSVLAKLKEQEEA